MAISLLYNPVPSRLFEADGDFASGALAHFFLARTTTPLSVFTDAPLAIPHPWPVVADAYGLLPPIYIEKGIEYKIRIEDAAGNILYAADSIDNPAEPDSVAGGGIVVTSEQVHQTGDIIWNAVTGARTGWVLCNGKTIGAPTSTADAKSTDYHDLFFHLWTNFSNNLCPVSSGRGANAQADWDTNKSIATLDMRGRSMVGLDDMGNSAANVIQATTTISTTNASTAATVALAAGLCAGMFVNSANVPVGTKIASISGTVVTLSANATATASGTAAQFSMFTNAAGPNAPGAGGGENVHAQLLAELATHSHANTVTATGSGTATTSQTSQGTLVSTVTEPFSGVGHSHNVVTSAASTDQLVGRASVGDGATYDLTGGTNDSMSVAAFTDSAVSGVTVATSFSAYPSYSTTITGMTITPTITNVTTGSSSPMNLQTPARLGSFFMKM